MGTVYIIKKTVLKSFFENSSYKNNCPANIGNSFDNKFCSSIIENKGHDRNRYSIIRGEQFSWPKLFFSYSFVRNSSNDKNLRGTVPQTETILNICMRRSSKNKKTSSSPNDSYAVNTCIAFTLN